MNAVRGGSAGGRRTLGAKIRAACRPADPAAAVEQCSQGVGHLRSLSRRGLGSGPPHCCPVRMHGPPAPPPSPRQAWPSATARPSAPCTTASRRRSPSSRTKSRMTRTTRWAGYAVCCPVLCCAALTSCSACVWGCWRAKQPLEPLQHRQQYHRVSRAAANIRVLQKKGAENGSPK